MNSYGHSAEPPDTREEPECICPDEGPAEPGCPWYGRHREPVYPVIRIRDAAGVRRIGYVESEQEDEGEE